jgi:hypothetical protein
VLTLAGSTIDGANIEASAPFVAHDVYPGIDLSASTIGGDPSYTFVVTPAGDPRDIELTFPTASQVRIAAHGGLLVGASDATYRQPKPLVYQIVGAHMVQIGARYVRRPEGAIGIRIDPYAEGLALVIDPGLHRVEAR